MPFQAAVFVTQRELDIFGHFVKVEEGWDGRTMTALDIIGMSVCKSTRESGIQGVTYMPRDLSQAETYFIGQVNFSSSADDAAILRDAAATLVTDIAAFKKTYEDLGLADL